MDLQLILEMAEESLALKPDGFDGDPNGYDKAILGLTDNGQLVYSKELMVESLLETDKEMTEEEAWKLVTLNPAKILHLDQRMGSVKAGKDADLVLWTANPLSIMARASMTIVDGVIYYEEAVQEAKLTLIQKERNRILALMLASNELGEPSKAPQKKVKKHFHCDTLGEEAETEENTH
jgi:adenine deaminase